MIYKLQYENFEVDTTDINEVIKDINSVEAVVIEDRILTKTYLRTVLK